MNLQQSQAAFEELFRCAEPDVLLSLHELYQAMQSRISVARADGRPIAPILRDVRNELRDVQVATARYLELVNTELEEKINGNA